MGNNPSSEGISVPRPGRVLGRTTGALGLSRRDLDDRCKPSGLYPSCQWEEKAIRRLIADGKLAARLRGSDARNSDADRECPICFLQYPQINVTKCCSANICTECYLQVRPQKEKNCACPFCNNAKLLVTVAKQMDEEAVKERHADEQRVIEATIRARADTFESLPSDSGSSEPGSPTPGFGSSLQQNSRVQMMRARSESLSSTDPDAAMSDDEMMLALAVSENERRALEEEMRQQHTHPLARQVEQEAEERRIENERNYYRSNSARVNEARAADLLRRGMGTSGRRNRSGRTISVRGSRNWNDIVDAFERGGGGEVQSLDDLVVLEAALVLSMEEESRRRSQGNNEGGGFDAAQHAREGFPLVERFLSRRDSRNTDESEGSRSSADLSETIQGLARRMSNSRARRQFGRTLSNPMVGDPGLRYISEAEQIEMAIALSLQQAQEAGNEEAAENEEATETQADQPESEATVDPSLREDSTSATEGTEVQEASQVVAERPEEAEPEPSSSEGSEAVPEPAEVVEEPRPLSASDGDAEDSTAEEESAEPSAPVAQPEHSVSDTTDDALENTDANESSVSATGVSPPNESLVAEASSSAEEEEVQDDSPANETPVGEASSSTDEEEVQA